VVVEPTEKDLFNGELEEVFNGFSGLQEAVEFGVVDQVNLGE